MMKDDDKEDEKEKDNGNKNIEGIELGFSLMGQLMNNEAFVNMASEMVKNIDINQLVSNVVNQPQYQNLQLTPEEIALAVREQKILRGTLEKETKKTSKRAKVIKKVKESYKKAQEDMEI